MQGACGIDERASAREDRLISLTTFDLLMAMNKTQKPVFRVRLINGLLAIVTEIVLSIVPASVFILISKFRGATPPEMFGWTGVFLLTITYAPLTTVISSLSMGLLAFRHHTHRHNILATSAFLGLCHGGGVMIAPLSVVIMLGVQALLSVVFLVLIIRTHVRFTAMEKAGIVQGG